MTELRTIIAGSRDLGGDDLRAALNDCPWAGEITSVVSGGARGIDWAGERWAQAQQLPVHRITARWSEEGKAAGPRRNERMARAADALLAVWDGRSKGTRHMIAEARKRGLLVYVHVVKEVPGDD